jgi:hypothetical protein
MEVFFMKRIKLFLLGTLVIGMAFGLVLAGCASATAVEDPTAAELAAQLAADINAIEAGKATVSGDTVTFTGGVRLTTTLTVPEDVTLDLTKETLQLGDNAIFTVNGTVNAKAAGINIDSAAATPATINGSGTISLKSKGRMLDIWEGKKLTLDGVTLVGLEDNDSVLVEVNNGSELVMKSGAITGNTPSPGNQGGGVDVRGSSVFIMEGGTISGNTKAGGGYGSVCVWDGSTFTMKGGAITDNNARGVFANSATFIMEGGDISGNNREGVFLHTKGIFTMSGGVIYGNTSPEGGGGVGLTGDSFFTMTGGRIQGSTDSDGFTKNTAARQGSAALWVNMSTAKWGTGGTYTIGGASQPGGSDIAPSSSPNVGTDDTLIAMLTK